jgi:hypothetical protein
MGIYAGAHTLVHDFQELYRYLTDDFVIQYCQTLGKKDFTVKSEDFSTKRKGKREYLNDFQTRGLVKGLNQYFQSKVRIPRIRMGDKQEIETLISEEALLFAMFLRDERPSWKPRIASLDASNCV